MQRASFAALGAMLVLALADRASAAIGTPVLQWQACAPGFCDPGWYPSPAVVRAGATTLVVGGGYRLIAVRGDIGALQWTYPASGSPGRIWPSPAISDLNGDGTSEIVVAQTEKLSVLDTSGVLEPSWPSTPFGSTEIRTLGIADLDGNGASEILTARAGPFTQGVWSVLEPNATTRPGWPRLAPTDPGFAFGAYNENMAAADLDGDGDLEIVASSDVHYLAAFANDGTPLPASPLFGAGKNWSQVGVHYDQAVDLRGFANCDGSLPLEPRANFAGNAPAIDDLDRDGTNEIVVVGSFYDCSTPGFDQLFQVPMIFERDRTRWSAGPFDWTALPVPDGAAAPRTADFTSIEEPMPNPVLADLDGDGRKEILHASYDGRVHAYWLDRTEHGAWPFSVNPVGGGLRFASEPVVADLDGDGDGEVLFTTWTTHVSNEGGDLVVVDSNGQELSRVALPRTAESWDGALAAPTLAQLDGDAALEVVVHTVHSGLVAYEIPGSVASGLRWPTGRGSFARAAPEPGFLASTGIAIGGLAVLGRRRRMSAVR